jgi:hypothetical protein
MSRWISIAGWVITVAFAIAYGIQRESLRESESRAREVQAAATEMFQLKLQTDAGNARWLVVGLRQLRNGETSDGYETLDALVAAIVKSAHASGSDAAQELLVEPRRYLESVGG